jgi:glycine/D-amino acid oxidase-like deaminating enzyme
MPRHHDAIVVGAGIVGLCVAYYLVKAGLKTISIDQGYITTGTSGAGNGNIIVGNRQPGLLAELARRSLLEYERMGNGEMGDFELKRSGSYLLLETQAQAEEARQLIARQKSRGLALAYLSTVELAEAVPGVSVELAGAVYCRDDCSLNPLLFLRALRRRIQDHGGSFAFYETVGNIKRRRSGLFRVCTGAGTYRSPVVVDCAGVQAGLIASLLGEQVPVAPNKGHIVVTEKVPHLRIPAKLRDWADASDSQPAAGEPVNTVIESTAAGNLLIGKSEAGAESPACVSLPTVRAILARALRFLPRLREVKVIRIYTGLRPRSEDGLPIIGASAVTAGLYYACGHGGDGVSSAPETGRLLSRLIAEGQSERIMREFTPARFIKP